MVLKTLFLSMLHSCTVNSRTLSPITLAPLQTNYLYTDRNNVGQKTLSDMSMHVYQEPGASHSIIKSYLYCAKATLCLQRKKVVLEILFVLPTSYLCSPA